MKKDSEIELEIQKHKNIPLILNSYEDIFSSFDPRPYSERALSDDFLIECKRAARDKELELELILSVPGKKRILSEEIKILKRLKEHFKKHHIENEKEIKKLKKEGFMWVCLGIFILIGVILGSFYIPNNFLKATIAVFEIPSWFLVWEGMRKILIDSLEKEPEHIFYQKMANAEIKFKSY